MSSSTAQDNVWSTAKIEKVLEQFNLTGTMPRANPFFEKDVRYRAANINFEYTNEEILELAKCKEDIMYFAEKYCKLLTDSGWRLVKYREYQKKNLLQFKKYLKNVVLQSRQSAKTTTVAVFIAYYLLFEAGSSKNILIASATGDKAKEFSDKTEEIICGLPFFMKPGYVQNAVYTKSFENGCNIFVETTSERTGAGKTIHLCLLDEMALIQKNIKNALYRTLIPTLSSSKIARLIIMSTPRGLDKFAEIYLNAVRGKNNFNPIRVDWWEVPLQDENGDALVDKDGNIIYRGEEWKWEQIADLGSEEDFNQEYGNQFLAGNQLLFKEDSLRKLKNWQSTYVYRKLEVLEELGFNYSGLLWHKDFDLEQLENEANKFVLSIDLAGGDGGDYSVLNLFQILPMTKKEIEGLTLFSSETDFFKLVQVGMFSSNRTQIPELAALTYHIAVDLIPHENIKCVLENNYDGNYFVEKLSGYKGYDNELEEDHFLVNFPYNLIWKDAITFKTGITQSVGSKDYACKIIKDKVKYNQLVITEKGTIDEAFAFSKGASGGYEGQGDHDDRIMTCVNICQYYSSPDYMEQIEEILEHCPEGFIKAIESKLSKNFGTDEDDLEDIYS